MTGDCEAAAPPTPQPIRVHVVKTGTGSGTVTSFPSGINCGSICQKYMANGQKRLDAVPAAGSTFAGWVVRQYGYAPDPEDVEPPITVCTTSTARSCTFTLTGINEYRATAKFNLTKPPVPNTVLLSKPPKTTKSKSATFYWGSKLQSQPREESLQVAVQVRQGEELDDLQAGQAVHEAQAGHAHVPRPRRQHERLGRLAGGLLLEGQEVGSPVGCSFGSRIRAPEAARNPA